MHECSSRNPNKNEKSPLIRIHIFNQPTKRKKNEYMTGSTWIFTEDKQQHHIGCVYKMRFDALFCVQAMQFLRNTIVPAITHSHQILTIFSCATDTHRNAHKICSVRLTLNAIVAVAVATKSKFTYATQVKRWQKTGQRKIDDKKKQ